MSVPWTVTIIEVGVIPGLPLSLYLPGVDPTETLDVPCYAYLLKLNRAAVLVDTGPEAHTASLHGHRILGDATGSLIDALASEGVRPDDVELVVHTHLHYDHCENDGLFTRASIVVQADEVAHAAEGHPFYDGAGELCATLGQRLTTIVGDTQLRPGLRTILTRGHTPGHQSVVVETTDGEVCICGDIVPLARNVDVIAESCPDQAATRAFLDRARDAGWAMIPSHDPALRDHDWYWRR